MIKRFLQILLLLLSISLVNLSAATIKGRVIDSNTHETIIGATVLVENQKYYAVSDANGNYSIAGLAEGKYMLFVKSLGYITSYSQEIEVKNGQDVISYDFYLKHDEVSLSEVEVSGNASRTTDLSARNSERNADNIINVMSAKSIELSPDMTVANVIGRMSGVTIERDNTGDGQYAILRGMDKRFNYTMVNGVKIPSPDNKNRFVPLDIFPSELLDRLEVSKSLTADMEGDGIGGATNMVMKDAPSNIQLTANLATGYNSLFFSNDYQSFDAAAINKKSPSEKYGLSYPVQMKDFTTKNLHLNSGKASPNLLGGFSFGDRFLKDKIGVMLAGSYQESIRGNSSDVYNPSVNPDGTQPFTHRFYSNQQTRLGIHNKFDVKLSENHKIMWYNAYMDLGTAQVREAISCNTQTTQNSQTTRLRWNHQAIMNSTLKGFHFFDHSKLNVDWYLSYGKALNETPDNFEIEELINSNGITSVEQSDGTTRRWEHNSDKDLAGNANIKYSINLKNGTILDLSTGGLYRNKVRNSYFNEYYFSPDDESKDNPHELIRGVDYTNFDQIKFSVKSFGDLSNPLNYDATEKIGAGYVMGKLSLEKFRFIAGVRAEHTDQGYNLKFTTQGARNEGDQKYIDILPSLNIKYTVHKNANLHLSYYKAINRPSFFEIVPYTIINEDYTEHGNPDLKHTRADNFDLRYEYFPSPLEQFMIGFFYKRIQDPIEFGMMNGFGQDTYYMPMNFGDANNYGVEMDVIKYFGWLGMKANYTYTSSDITTTKMKVIANPDTSAENKILTEYVNQTRPLFGQAEHVVNFSLLFKDKRNGWEGQLSFAYTGKRICIVSRYLDDDTWQAGYITLDASAEKKFKSGWTLFVKASNILNSPMIQYIKRNANNDQITDVKTYHGAVEDRKEYYGLNIAVGLKFKFQ